MIYDALAMHDLSIIETILRVSGVLSIDKLT